MDSISTMPTPRFLANRHAFSWVPISAPGVDPSKSLSLLRPAGPPPTGRVAPPAEPAVISQNCELETLLPLPSSPGLDDCEQPQVRKRCLIENPSQFRDIAPYLATGRDAEGNQVSIEALCPICGSLLELDDNLMPTRAPEQETEPLVVLPCGHLFGMRCIETHFLYKAQRSADNPYAENAGRPDCPICRLSLERDGCRHNVELKPYDPDGPGVGQQLPPTVAEGGWVAGKCRACELEPYAPRIQDFCAGLLEDLDPCYYTRREVVPAQVDQIRSALRDVLWSAVVWQTGELASW